MDSEQRIKQIDREIIKVGIIDAPGSIMFGLGLYAKFAANGDAFHPLLNNESVVSGLLIGGAAIMLWGGYRMFALSREKVSIQKARTL